MSTERLTRLQQKLKTYGVDLLIVEDPTDLYYLTSLELSCGTLAVDEEGASLFVDGRYTTACKKQDIVTVQSSEGDALKELLCGPDIKTVGIDAETMTVSRLRHYEGICASKLVALQSPLTFLRMVKDKAELSRLRAAATLGIAGYDYAVTLLKPGITEIEVANKLEIFWKERGATGPAFSPIIAFGENSALPHHRAGKTALKENDCALIDIGVILDHYPSDMTRVVFIGKPDSRLTEIYKVVAEAQAAAIALLRAGVTAGAVDAAARDLITEKGYGANFTHGLGHGVGLAIHEPPYLRGKAPHASVILQNGMVVTVEPGIYLPSIGGVRIEDTLVVTEEGCENLTRAATK